MKIELENGDYPGVSEEIIDFTEKNLRVKLPKEFIDILKRCDRAVLKNREFDIIEPQTHKKYFATIINFVSFDPSSKNNILQKFFYLPDARQKKILPFAYAAGTGDADYLCFDYSIDGWDDPDPPVVCWLRSNPEGQDIADVAITFKAFLEKLRPPEDSE